MVFRINKTENYTVMGNYHLREKDMSLKAKGLMSIMLSLPKDWDYSINGLANLSKDGKDSVMSTLNELENFGYLIRTKHINEKGQFDGYNYDIYEKPNTDKPCTGNPNTDNQTQLNTIIINNKNNNKEINKESFSEEDLALWFSKVYEIYPRKVSKVKAKEMFERKLRGLDKETAYKKAIAIYRMLERQVEVWESEKRETSYLPYPASWLNDNVENSPHFKKGRKM